MMMATKAIAVMTKIEVQRRQHAAIVQPGQEHDGQNDEGLLVEARMALHAWPPYRAGSRW